MRSPQLSARTLSDRLVDVVRDIILSGAISPNVPIRQDALAAELQVSKIPLREALARLEQDGLVVSQPNRGFFVRPMSWEEAQEIFALRLKIEPDAAADGCLLATEENQASARKALDVLAAAAAERKASVGPLNRAFHMELVRPNGQQITNDLVGRLNVLADRYVRKHLESRGRDARAEAEHEDILKYWLRRQPAKVRELVARHISLTLDDLSRELQPEPPPQKPKRPTSKVKRVPQAAKSRANASKNVK